MPTYATTMRPLDHGPLCAALHRVKGYQAPCKSVPGNPRSTGNDEINPLFPTPRRDVSHGRRRHNARRWAFCRGVRFIDGRGFAASRQYRSARMLRRSDLDSPRTALPDVHLRSQNRGDGAGKRFGNTNRRFFVRYGGALGMPETPRAAVWGAPFRRFPTTPLPGECKWSRRK
jgi:hypothetical protein